MLIKSLNFIVLTMIELFWTRKSTQYYRPGCQSEHRCI